MTMTDLKLNTSLSPGQAQFALLLEKLPFAARFWNMEMRECDLDAIEDYVGGIASHQQAVMTRWLVAVWLGENKLNFDLIDAAGCLDPELMRIITAWSEKPFWP